VLRRPVEPAPQIRTRDLVFSRYPRCDCLKLDTEVMSADLNAQEIVRRFGLGAMQNS
jgi:hypothetical protein